MIASIAHAGSVATALPPQAVSQAPVTQTQAAQPSSAGQSQFSASYAPEIYAVYLNGLSAGAGVASPALETNVWQTSIALARLEGEDPDTAIPGAPPIVPWPPAEGTQVVIQSLGPLAGSGRILSSGSAPTATASMGARQSSGSSHSTSHVATK